MELDIIINLQKISFTALDYLLYALTYFGDEIFVLLVAGIIFWCVDKRFGYKLINVYIMGQMFTTIFKAVFKRQRPYNKGARAILTKSGGYSFPSGHSESIANISTQLILFCKKKQPKLFKSALIAGIIVTAVVMFSRMYLGQHYLTDVIAGAALGLASAWLFSFLFDLLGNKEEWLMIILFPVTSILAAVFIVLTQNGDVVKVLGAYGAVSLGYFIEKRYIGYNVKSGRFYKHLIKAVLGGAIIMLLKEGLKRIGVSAGLTGKEVMVLDYFRYFSIGIFASFFAPLIFKSLKL